MFRSLDQFCHPRSVPSRNRDYGVMPHLMQYTCQNQKYPVIDDCDQAITTPQAAAARRDFSGDCRRTDVNMSSTRYLLPNSWLEDYWNRVGRNRTLLAPADSLSRSTWHIE